jgi:SAM-dependent methyltransferase
MESLGQKEQVWTDVWSATNIETEIKMWDYYGLRPWILKYSPRFGKVLEAGCGLGKFNFYLSHFGIETIGLDFSKNTIDFLNSWQKQNNYQIPFVVGDIKNMPYDNNSLSGYLSFGVMEHFIEGPQIALKEAHRVLRPGGIAIITTPNNSWNIIRGRTKKKVKDSIKKVIGKKVFTQPFFQYYYSPPKLKKLVEKSGLMVTKNAGAAMLYTFVEYLGEKKNRISQNSKFYKFSRFAEKNILKRLGSQSITISVKLDEKMHCFLCGERNAGLKSLEKYDVPICNDCESQPVTKFYKKNKKVGFHSDYIFNPSIIETHKERCNFCSNNYNTNLLFEKFGFNKNVCSKCLKSVEINLFISNNNLQGVWRDRKTAEKLNAN